MNTVFKIIMAAIFSFRPFSHHFSAALSRMGKEYISHL